MFVDTNVLVAVRFVTAPHHRIAVSNLDRLGNSPETLRISRQVLREYLVVVTRPQSWSTPLPMADAVEDVRRLAMSFAVLEVGPGVMEMLTALCRKVPIAGKQVHDANIVATMLAHGERRLLTFNTRDFRRYGDRIDLIDMEMAGGSYR